MFLCSTWAIIFFVIAIIAGLLGFRDVSSLATQIAKFLFFYFCYPFPDLTHLSIFFHTAPPAPLPALNQ